MEVVKQIYPICLRKESYKLLTEFYDCNLKCSDMNYNGKYMYRHRQETNTKQKYLLDKCILLDRNEAHDEPKSIALDSVMPYILNSYCCTDIIRNITSAQSLNEQSMLYKLLYNDLNKVYKHLKVDLNSI